MSFLDRTDAGRRLARALTGYRRTAPIVLALPRGGVPVAAEVAAALGAELDLLLVRKIGVPFQPELAMGAVADGAPPITVRNEEVIALAGVSKATFDAVREQELAEISRRRARYLGDRPRSRLAGRTVIVVDDGVATGATVRAALRCARAQHPGRLVLATPVAAPDVIEALSPEADEIVCLEQHDPFGAIGLYYSDFSQVSDEEVVALLAGPPAPST